MAKPKNKRSTKPVISGSAIRFEQPKSNRGQQHHPMVIVSPPDIHPVSGFLDFLREHAVVSLAIAFVIGLQSQTLVKQLVTSFIDPLFKLLFGQTLSQRTLTLHLNGRAANFTWGAFVYGLLNFLFVLAAVYAVVKVLNLENLDKPTPKPKPEAKHKKEVDDVYDVD